VSELLSGGLAGILGAAFAPLYLDATLHRPSAPEYDDGGTIINASTTDIACKAQVDAVTEAMRQSPGFTDRDQRILVLSSTLSGTITTDDSITVGGQHWSIASVATDPVGAYFELRGQLA